MTICILGRQPKIGLAELESLYGNNVQPLGEQAALVDIPNADINHDQLGGPIKIAKLLTILPTTDWGKLADYCRKQLPKHLQYIPEGKIKLGLSVYGLRVNPKTLERSGLELKKVVKTAGRSVRIVPSTGLELSSAQVIHNQLTGPQGLELLFIEHKGQTYLAQTTSVQDIEAYAKRDFGRPMRDAFVGMLPPKLAQIMLNLAQAKPGERVLDPFCGTGVLLQEAALRGCSLYGTDLQERMVRYTRDNIHWIQEHAGIRVEKLYEVADATEAKWSTPLDHVVCETYLGQPLSGLPKPEKLQQIMQDCDTIIRKFLQNIRPQLQSGTRCCIAVPAWNVNGRFKHLSLIDDLEKMGYNRISFSYANDLDLVYHRKEQIVARELLVLTVK